VTTIVGIEDIEAEHRSPRAGRALAARKLSGRP